MKKITYPFIHNKGTISYVEEDNKYIIEAKNFALKHSLDHDVPTGTVIVKDGKIIGYGANGSDYHEKHGCERKRQNIPTGQNYELCEGCSPINHGEPKAVHSAKEKGHETNGAEAYLWGHWWACESCWNTLVESGINNLYLMKNSEVLFNKSNPKNVLSSKYSVKTNLSRL